MKTGIWIYWRYMKDPAYQRTWIKSYVQNIVRLEHGDLLELADREYGTEYPTRVLLSDIIYNLPKS